MMQEFIVTWVNNVGEDRFSVFGLLSEAEEFMEEVTTEESYIYLSVIIKKQ